MERELIAICPRCGMRAKIVSYRYDWDRDENMAQLRCQCGRYEVPFLESRVLDVDLNNPYLKETHFRVLLPEGRDDDIRKKINKCLTASWNTF